MSSYRDLMQVLDSKDNMTLYRLKNDIFDTVALVYNEDTAQEETYVLLDMQGQFSVTIDDISDYDWIRSEDIKW